MLVKLLQRAFRRKGKVEGKRSTDSPLAEQSSASPADLVSAAIEHAQRGNTTLSEQLVCRALALDANDAAAHDTLGNVLRMQDRLEDALASFQQALRLAPLRISTLSNIGLCLRDLGRLDEARMHLERAAQLDATDPTIATNLAALLFDMGHFDAAHACIETVLHRHPDFTEAHIVRGTRLLRRSDFARGWIDYEWRDRDVGRPGSASFPYPIWDGNPFSNEWLLVCAEQGLGDQIMFGSCIDDLLRIAPNCIIECDARLKALLTRSFPQARFYALRTRGEQMWLNDGLLPVAKTWLGSLPGYFRRQVIDFPNQAGYLRADPAKVAKWTESLKRLGPGPKIGISWRGGTATTRRTLRSIPLKEWIPVLRCPGLHFISLQYGDCGAEIEQLRSTTGASFTHWESAIEDYDETAALVSALDLVISVQTAVVHLAGALGKPVWVLVSSTAEWRYGETGASMPWYPSAELFRQEPSGNWVDVIDRVVRSVQTRF